MIPHCFMTSSNYIFSSALLQMLYTSSSNGSEWVLHQQRESGPQRDFTPACCSYGTLVLSEGLSERCVPSRRAWERGMEGMTHCLVWSPDKQLLLPMREAWRKKTQWWWQEGAWEYELCVCVCTLLCVSIIEDLLHCQQLSLQTCMHADVRTCDVCLWFGLLWLIY